MKAHTIAVLRSVPEPDVIRRVTAGDRPVGVDAVIDPVGDLDPRRRWASPAGAAAVVQLDGHRPDVVREGVPADALLGILLVERREMWRDGVSPPEPGARSGLRQISFVAPCAGADFADRYERHMDIVRAEHPGVSNYRQDLVVDRIDADETLADTAAVSQLWFATDADFADRYYASEQSPSIVRADVQTFLDFERTWSVLTRAHHR